MEKYIISKQDELRKCANNYMEILNDPSGNAFTNGVLEPLYTKLNAKFCSPSSTVSYINHLIDLPDAVYTVNKKCEYFETIIKNTQYTIALLFVLVIIMFIVLYTKK
jgi:hypothetical protein